MEQHSFGYWLRLKRKALDLTQDGLADRVGCSAATIRKIEAEERRPSAQIVERLAEIFNIDPKRTNSLSALCARRLAVCSHYRKRRCTLAVPVDVLPRSNLPATTTSLIGREQEIAVVLRIFVESDIRLVTLIGPPGIGKTRLSIEAARAALSDFPDGVFFVALAPLDDPILIAPTVAQALGYVEAKNISPNEQLIEGIGDKNVLLVLDNCEHLIEDVASLALPPFNLLPFKDPCHQPRVVTHPRRMALSCPCVRCS